MLPYFPFDSAEYRMTLGVQALEPDSLIDIDEHYCADLALKSEILASDHGYYFQALAGSEPLQWEAIELLLPMLARRYPQHFGLETDGTKLVWHNRCLSTVSTLRLGDAASLPLAPLDWLGRQVQEDLLLMTNDQAMGIPLVAGQLCFATAWSLDEKMGQSFLHIHGPVPLFADQIGRSSHLMMERLKPGRPVGRVNWSFTTTDRLNLAPRFEHEVAPTRLGIRPEQAGTRCFLRLERQTLSRLPRSGGVLFTIHIYRTPVETVAAEPARAQRMASVLRSMPSELVAYKRMTPYIEPLITYLEQVGR